ARIVNGIIDIGAVEDRLFTITVWSGNNQSTPANTVFAAPLVVIVSSAAGEPVNGGVVMFAAPSSGASTAPATYSATIDSSRRASVTVTANNVAGSYIVGASARGAVAPAKFR